jgi:hypothetical protein
VGSFINLIEKPTKIRSSVEYETSRLRELQGNRWVAERVGRGICSSLKSIASLKSVCPDHNMIGMRIEGTEERKSWTRDNHKANC